MNRRQLLRLTGLLAATGAVSPLAVKARQSAKAGLPLHDVRSHGAQGDGKTLDTKAINEAVQACHEAGGGLVYAGPGTYLSGTVNLLSNVTQKPGHRPEHGRLGPDVQPERVCVRLHDRHW